MSKRPYIDNKENSPRMRRYLYNQSFRLKDNNAYKGSYPVYKQPQEVTSYSIDENRQLWFDNREMRYYYPPTHTDLNVGYEHLINRDESVLEHIDTLLDALTHIKTKTKTDTSADFITWRGIMTKILCTPYARREPWELRATRYKDTIYMEEQVTQAKKQQEANANQRQKLMSYWGYRFETISTVKKPPRDIKKDDQELRERDLNSANTNQQYCIVAKTRLGNNSILMGAEVDCCLDIKPSDPQAQLANYVELKTSRIIENDKQQYTFDRYKLLKFWAQSFLIGVPRIMCGFRDDHGYIKQTVQYKTLEIPRLVRDKPNSWDASVCLNFADQLLNWIKTSVTEDDPAVTYSIKFEYPFEDITIECTHHDHVFITQRYIEGRTQHEIGGPRVTSNAMKGVYSK